MQTSQPAIQPTTTVQATTVPLSPLAVLKPKKASRVYTLEEYLRKDERSPERLEYYNGKIIQIPMARGPHNIITANTITILNNKINEIDADFTVFTNNQKVYLPALNYGLYPDALVVSESPKYWDENEVLLTNPLLIVEVLSKSTHKYDRQEKFEEYKTLPSFREYVLIDQTKMQVETRFREEPDLWRFKTYTNPEEPILLKSIGCSINMPAIYKKVNWAAP